LKEQLIPPASGFLSVLGDSVVKSIDFNGTAVPWIPGLRPE